MIVCDMCPDRTPATFRLILESIDSEKVRLTSEDPLGLEALIASMGLLPKAGFRTTVALCVEHSKVVSQDPIIGRVLLEDAIRANRGDTG